MKETEFEVFPLHVVVDITPIPPDTKVVSPSGGLNTKTSTVPNCAMSAAVMTAISWGVLTNVVTRNEPFQLTKESRRKSLPLTVNGNWLPPAVALVGEMEAIHGNGGQVPQDSAVTSVIAIAPNTGNLAIVAIGLHLRQTGGRQARCRAVIREDRRD